MTVVGIGTPHDWIGRTADFAGMGTVLVVLVTGIAAFCALRPRMADGGAAGLAALAAMCTLVAVDVLDLRPSPWWTLALSAYGAFAAWDLRRTLRRER